MKEALPELTPEKIVTSDFGLHPSDKQALPMTWLAAKALNLIWLSKVNKKCTSIQATRAALEAGIMLLRKTRINFVSTTHW